MVGLSFPFSFFFLSLSEQNLDPVCLPVFLYSSLKRTFFTEAEMKPGTQAESTHRPEHLAALGSRFLLWRMKGSLTSQPPRRLLSSKVSATLEMSRPSNRTSGNLSSANAQQIQKHALLEDHIMSAKHWEGMVSRHDEMNCTTTIKILITWALNYH